MKNFSGKVLFLFLLVILVSCSGQQIIGGGNGVKIDFMDQENKPPKEVLSGQDFNVGLKLSYNGKNPVNGKICLRDIIPENDIYGYSNPPSEGGDCIGFNLLGSQLVYERGQVVKIKPVEQTILFPEGGTYIYERIQKETDETFTAEILLSYDSEVRGIVEIDPNLKGKNSIKNLRGQRDSAITLSNGDYFIDYIEGSGIATIRLDLEFSDAGGGEIYNFRGAKESFVVNTELVDYGSFICTNNNVPVLEKGKWKLNCNIKVPIESVEQRFSKEVILQYSYDYKQIKSLNVKLKPSEYTYP